MDHQADAWDRARHSKIQRLPLEPSVVPNDNAHDNQPEARSDGVDVPDVGCHTHARIEHNDQHGEEMGVPNVPDHIQAGDHCEGEEDSPVFHETPWNESHWSYGSFV